MQAHLSATVAEHDQVAGGDRKRGRIVGMDHHFRPPLIGKRGRRLGEGRIEKAARRRGGKPERMRGVGFLDHLPMIRQLRKGHGRRHGAMQPAERHFGPIRLEAEFAVRIGEAVDIMRGGEIGLAIDPAFLFEFGERTPAGFLQCGVDQFARRHVEAGMPRAKPLAERVIDLVVGAAFAARLDQLRAEQNILAAAGGIKIVVLEEAWSPAAPRRPFWRCRS